MKQRTNEWYLARKGKFTASEIHKLLSRGRSKSQEWGDTATTYIRKKIYERMMPDDVFLGYYQLRQIHSKALEWGEAVEAEARDVYAFKNKIEVKQSGFIFYNDYSGCSLDGELPDNGIIEIKCPYNGENHIKNLTLSTSEDLKKENPEYYWQIQCQLLMSGADYCDFISYDPGLNEKFQMKTLQINPHPDDMAFIEERINKGSHIISSILLELTEKSLSSNST